MGIKVVKTENNVVHIGVTDEFGGAQYPTLIEECKKHSSQCRFQIDLKNVPKIDTSSIGVLMLLRDYLGTQGEQIVVSGLSEEVKKKLSISNLEKILKFKAA
ncbi:MAG: STAS domain-containing protein [Gammaproteobacteria bacterium]|nr:STAS domain-containing protein [Gammaproteobacteria bacterium]MDH5694928.1 STAS domain-containing protein [Gammaproteobacteria bacterium]